MTGRDLIIYIMENNLENMEMFENGKIPGFLTIADTAEKFGVGIATVEAYVKLDALPHISIGEVIYIPEKAPIKC
jgi:hypothetical protein